MNRIKMTLCWTDISGYMAACWRALAAIPEIDLRVIAFEPAQQSFAADLVAGLNCRLLSRAERDDERFVKSLVAENDPQIVYLTGWFHRPYRKLLSVPELKSASMWMGVDTPWWGTPKQQLGRFILPRLLRRVDRIFVAGERAWQYMRVLGVPQHKIRRGLYGVDYDGFSPLYDARLQQPAGWPRKFLFIGRYAPEKGLPTLVEAYRRYRQNVEDPWILGCCGGGELGGILRDQPGIVDHGFQQPAQLRQIMATSGAFVLASDFDPWPLVVVEAASAGLPILCTEACGSAVEIVRSYFNGLTTSTGDPDALAAAMRWMHENDAAAPIMGQRGRELAAAYSSQMWAIRWAQAARQCLPPA